MQKNDERLGSAPLGKLMLSMALPAVAAQIINVLYNIVAVSYTHLDVYKRQEYALYAARERNCRCDECNSIFWTVYRGDSERHSDHAAGSEDGNLFYYLHPDFTAD